MKCIICTRKMSVHYSSSYCSWCTANISELPFFTGYIVNRNDGMQSPHHVFKHVSSAKKWKSVHNYHDAIIAKVLSPKAFEWQRSRGSLTNELVSKYLFHLANNHKFDPVEPFILLAPQDYHPPATPMPPSENEEDERSEGDRLCEFFASSLNR